MKFRAPTFQVSRDPNEDGFKPAPFRVSTMPILREKKSKANINNGIKHSPVEASETESGSPSSAGTRELPALLRKKRSKSFLGGFGGGDRVSPTNGGSDASREDIPSVPSMPMRFLKRKLSRPNLSNGGSESSGDSPEVPPVPSMFVTRKPVTKPSAEGAEWTPGDDGRIVSKKEVLRDLWTKTGASKKVQTPKIDTRVQGKKAKTAPERFSPVQRQTGSPDTANERPATSREERRRTKSFDVKRTAARPASRKLSIDTPTAPAESAADLAKKLLTVEQVRAMSIGAPAFSVEECDGRYKAQVIFRGSNAETSARFPKDYRPFGHASFAACTLANAEEQDDDKENLASNDEDEDGQKAVADLVEVPSMLGSQGLDPGTVGVEYFLQQPLANDPGRIEDWDTPAKRDLLATAPAELGLRPVNIEVLIYRLTELSQLLPASKEQIGQSSAAWNDTKIEEMGIDLFGKLLTPESGSTTRGSGGIDVATQIRALQRVLRTSGLWRDFSSVEWRTKVGQLLWETGNDDLTTEGAEIPCERDILLLQVTLAGELLVRLNVVQLRESVEPLLSSREMARLQKQRTTKISWDLLLAERFLANIDISADVPAESSNVGNRGSLISAIPFLTATAAAVDDMQELQPLLTPKHGEQQLAGLRYFSDMLQWPDTEDLSRLASDANDLNAIRKRFSRVPSTYLTRTPRLSTAQMSMSSSFGFGLEAEQPALSKTTTAADLQLTRAQRFDTDNTSIEGCGWLSRSWLSGMVMPGLAASQLLISTLLEHSPRAMAALGEGANPYGGFHYQGRSYWSKHSVVGRVIAAKKGAAECMDWIAVSGLSEGKEDGWVNVAVKDMPDSKGKPRITKPEFVARDSDLLRSKGLLGAARHGDFTWPADDPPILGNDVICHGLSFNDSVKLPPLEGEPIPKRRFIATLTFGSMIKRKLTTVDIPLMYDATFIASYPCHPNTTKSNPQSPPTLARPTPKPAPLSPFPLSSMENQENKDPATKPGLSRPKTAPGQGDSGYASKQTSASEISFKSFRSEIAPPAPTVPIHPLHVDYHYDIVPVSTLFTAATETRPRALSFGAEPAAQDVQAAEKEVMVLDCRGAEDLELFARAWCAKVGENAIIGKVGRTCLACCVREARALGVCVVIRV